MPKTSTKKSTEPVLPAANNAESNVAENVNSTAEKFIANDALNISDNANSTDERPVSPTPKRGKSKKSEKSSVSVKETASAVMQPAEDTVTTSAPDITGTKKKGGKKPKAEKAAEQEKKTSSRKKASAVTDVPAKTTQRKKSGRKPAALSAEKICDLLKKKLDKTAVAGITSKIAVDIEVWGVENEPDRRLYIEIKDGKAEILPYSYDDKDVKVYISYNDAVEILNGRLTLKDAVFSGKLTVQIVKNEGNILAALTLASVIKF